MRDQFQLWLIPPLLTACLSIWFRRKLSLEYGWPLLVQACLIVFAAIVGLFIGPKPLWTVITWLLFSAFMVVPTLYLRQCEHLFSTLNARALAASAKKIPFFYWGKLGRFWQDTYLSYACYIQGDEETGDRLLNFWKAQKLPPFFEETLDATRLAADGLLWHWDAIILELERRQANPESISASLCLQASRAYAEKGNIEMATRSLQSANLPNQRMDQRHLGLVFLQFFSLAGSENYAKEITHHLMKGAAPSMKLILNGWWARCLISVQKYFEAITLLDKLLVEAKSLNEKSFDSTPWIRRLENYRALAQAASGTLQQSDIESTALGGVHQSDDETDGADDKHSINEKNIELVWRIYQNACDIQRIVLPRRSSLAVNILLAIMVAAYIFSGCIDLIDNPFVLNIVGAKSQVVTIAANQGEFMFRTFYLNKSLVTAGQYYRLITYLFLHGNLSHLVLNAFGLIWFGRIANSIYGPWRFLVIFFVSGIAGGLTQIVFTDTSTVGASGSVFGIFAAVAIAIYRLRDVLPAQMRKRELRWMTIMTLCQIALDRLIPGIAGLAHLGGLVTGFVVGAAFFPKQQFQNNEKKLD